MGSCHGNMRTHKSPAPNVSCFIAQLVRAYREVTGSNPVEVLNFSVAKIAFITAKIKVSLDTNKKERLFSGGSKSAKGGPCLLADLDRGVQTRCDTGLIARSSK